MDYDAQKDALESYNFAISCKRKALLMERARGCAERVEVIGDSELYHGECLEVMSTLPDGSVDMILCDLPYGTTQNKWDTVIPFEPLWEQYWRVIKRNGAVVLTAAQPFTSALGASQIEHLRYSWVWEKEPSGNLNAKKRPMPAHEDVLVFCKDIENYYPQGLRPTLRKRSASDNSKTKNYGLQKAVPYEQTVTGYPTTVMSFGKDRDKLHPTQKPVALMEYLIRTYTNSGETVLDNTMGSGTTGVACKNAGRRFIGIERDPTYFEIAKDRISKAPK